MKQVIRIILCGDKKTPGVINKKIKCTLCEQDSFITETGSEYKKDEKISIEKIQALQKEKNDKYVCPQCCKNITEIMIEIMLSGAKKQMPTKEKLIEKIEKIQQKETQQGTKHEINEETGEIKRIII